MPAHSGTAASMLLVLSTLVASTAHAADASQCGKTPDKAELTIENCTAYIEGADARPGVLPLAYNARGDAYTQKGDFERGFADINKALAEQPNNQRFLNTRGIAYFRQKTYDLARADYDKAIALDPRNAVGYNNRGNTYAVTNDFKRALADYDMAIMVDASYKLAYYNRARVYASLGIKDKAIADLQKTLSLDPAFEPAQKDLNRLSAAQSALDRAASPAADAAAAPPASTTAIRLVRRGLERMGAGMLNEAQEDFTAALKADPKIPNAHTGLCDIHLKANRLEDAFSNCSMALRVNARDAGAYNMRGLIYRARGLHQEAMADFDKSISFARPNFLSWPFANRGLLNEELGNIKQAIADYNSALQHGASAQLANDLRARLTQLQRGSAGVRGSRLEQRV